MRIKIIGIITLSIFVFLVLGLLNFQLLQGKKYRDLSDKNCIRLIPQLGCRGKILDRNGEVIVDSVLSYDVMVLPQEAIDFDQTIARISRVLGISERSLKNKFQQSFISSSVPSTIAENIDIKKAIASEELKVDLAGVVIQPHPLRHYPYGDIASHVIGYLGEIDRWRLTKLEDYGYKTKDIVGFGGIEEKYDYYLRQEDGGTSIEVNRKGKIVRVVGFEPPQRGKDLQLTLNIKIQKIAEEALADKKGGVIMMDPYTGEIIALASSPHFDPGVFVAQMQDSIDTIVGSLDAPMFDRSISGVYPPGSIFKVIVAAAGLETGKISLSTSFYCPGEFHVGNQKFACWNTHNQQNLIEAIAHSCNVFFYNTGLLLGPQIMYDYAVKFGLSKPTSIDLPYEAGGFVPNPLWKKIYQLRHWFDGDTANFAIGQGDLQVTPLQMVRMMAVFANNGKLVRPYLLKSVEGKDISMYQRKAVKMPLKENTFRLIRQGLRGVVVFPKGTANVLSTVGIPVAGKTGTAQAAGGLSHAWFVGFFPYNEPKYVMCAFLERGGPGHYACLVAKQIIEKMKEEGLLE